MTDATLKNFDSAIRTAAAACKTVCEMEAEKYAGNAIRSEYKAALADAKKAIDAVDAIKADLGAMRRAMGKRAWMESGLGASTRAAEKAAYTEAFPQDPFCGSKENFVRDQIAAFLR